MKTKKNIGFIFLLTFLPFWGIAQCYAPKTRIGDDFFKKGEYQKAIIMWENAQKCTDKPVKDDLGSKISQATAALKRKPLPPPPTTPPPKPRKREETKQSPPRDPIVDRPLQVVVDKKEPEAKPLYLLQMIKVEGGTFLMGSNDPSHYADERPVHTVILRGYFMSQNEVTQKQWRTVMDGFPEGFVNKNCDDCPMNFVSWQEIQGFLTKLNQKTGKKYRLPTEAEWEYAAKGGSTKTSYSFSGGNDIQKVGWFADNSGGKIQVVGSKKANDLGINDLTGNVQEWCQDFYSETYYKSSAPNNPLNTQATEIRVVRGGAWNESAEDNRLTLRISESAATKSEKIGFRIVLDF